MNKRQLIEKITVKKEYSQLPKKDVEIAFENFNNDKYLDEEKIKLTRKLLREVFSSFTSQKLLSLKNKDAEWILKKHISTRERLPYYKELYERIFGDYARAHPPTQKNVTIIDLGAGVNGFSCKYFKKLRFDVNYIGVEAIGQLVDLMNFYFKKEKLKAKAIHLSLFELETVKKIIKEQKKPRVIFLFKTIDSLEMLEKDYSIKLLNEIVPLSDRIVISFATRSLGKRERFRASRKWIIDFIKENFKIMDDFELGGERYFVFNK